MGQRRTRVFGHWTCSLMLGKSLQVSHTCEHLPSCVCRNKKETEKNCFMQVLVYFNTQVQIIFAYCLPWWGPINQRSEWPLGMGKMPSPQKSSYCGPDLHTSFCYFTLEMQIHDKPHIKRPLLYERYVVAF